MQRDKRQLEEQPFKYAPPPLGFSEHEVTWIRLAILLPAKKFDDPLYCSLTHVPSSNLRRLQFEALSYTWGEQHDMQSLYCRTGNSSQCDPDKGPVRDDWGDLKITANLDRALRHLRFKKKFRALYVDAICINQQDTAEKEEQIALLPQVYAQCSLTIVWIGEPDAETAFVFRTMAALDRFDTVLRRVSTLNLDQTLPRWFRSMRGKGGTIEAMAQYDMAKNMKSDHPLKRRAAILALLVELKQLAASNPKDKVVGMTALAESLEMPLPALTYNLSEMQIFSGATRSWMKHLRCIDCLGLAVTPRNQPDLPSWAIDWSSPMWRDYGYLSTTFAAIRSTKWRTRWLGYHSATQGAIYSIPSTESGFDLKLWLRGVLLPDTVEQVHIPKPLGEPPDVLTSRDHASQMDDFTFHMASIVDWLIFLHGLNVKGGNASTPFRQLAPAFLLLNKQADVYDIDRAATAFEPLVQWAVEVRQLFAERSSGRFQDLALDELDRRKPSWTLYNSGFDTSMNMLLGIIRVAGFQMFSLFCTSGGLVGLCWGKNLKPGCRVALVAGWDFPIILGPTETEGEYTFCGPAYIHSLMDGHAWPSNEGDLQDIVLV